MRPFPPNRKLCAQCWILPLLLAGAFSAGLPGDTGKPITVYLVRHAEKLESSSNTDRDPPLSVDGQARASKLADLLKGCAISVVYTTPFQRTIDTAMPLVKHLRLAGSPVRTDPRDMAALLEQIRMQNGKNALVVGHSNTIPAIARALAGRDDAVRDIPETSYDNLFVVTITRWEPREASVKHFRFGKPSPGSENSSLPEFTGCKE